MKYIKYDKILKYILDLQKNMIMEKNEITGYDSISIYIDDKSVSGFFLVSPLANRLNSFFNINSDQGEANKPYKAAWMIHESKLFLGYVNGIKGDMRFYTTDLIPEFPDEELLYLYSDFSGILIMQTEQHIFPVIFEELTNNKKNISITIEKGKLTHIEGID